MATQQKLEEVRLELKGDILDLKSEVLVRFDAMEAAINSLSLKKSKVLLYTGQGIILLVFLVGLFKFMFIPYVEIQAEKFVESKIPTTNIQN